ncbi:MAG: hypothetical protein KA233_06385, partial [Novosphingobium sp.]|nr:hypothetical protein [Novosphingobium sp.]
MMRTLILAMLAALLAGCGSGSDLSGSQSLTISQSAMHSRIAALAECPSPLNRLGIGRITPRLFVGSDGDIDFVIPSAEDAEGSAVRFDLDGDESGGGQLRVSWTIDMSDTASELDLGEERLLTPARLAKELEEAVESYVSYYASFSSDGPAPSYRKDELAAVCKKFGRVVDGIAVITNPNLRKTIEKQKR